MKLAYQFICIALLGSIFYTQKLNAQIQQSGDLTTDLHDIISALPGDDGNEYQTPSPSALQDWGKLKAKNYPMVASLATPLGFSFVEYLDIASNQTYYCLWKNPAAMNYWGTYIFNANPCHSNLIIQSTHPRNDLNTGKEAAHVFENIGAFAVMIAETRRCNSTNFSPCDGMTSACLAGPA